MDIAENMAEPQDAAPVPGTQLAHNDDVNIMSVIANFASDPNFDVVKLEKLMDLNERMLNRSAKQAFAAAYVSMKPNLPTIVRTKENTHTKKKYAPLEDINEQVDPILQEHGFGTSTKIIAQTPDSVTVKAELWHSGGHIEETTIVVPLDNCGAKGEINKTQMQATASSVTYAKRIALCALLNISTGDDKDGNTESEFLEHEKAAEIDLLIIKAGADKNAFLKYMNAPKVQEILAKDYDKAKGMLNEKLKRNGAKQ